MRIDPKTGEAVDYTPRSVCSWVAMAAMFTSAGAGAGAAAAGTAAAGAAGAAGAAAAGATAASVGGTALAGATFAEAAMSAGSMAAMSSNIAATAAASSSGGLLATIGGAVSSLGWKDLVFGGLTAFSALSSIGAGKMQAAGLESRRMMEEFASKTEMLKGRREALEAASSLNEALEANIVRAAAGGVTSEGSVKAAQQAAVDKANFELDMSAAGAGIRAGTRRANARQLGIEADAAGESGYGTAAGTLASSFFRVARR